MADFRLVMIMLMAIVFPLGTSKPVFDMSDDKGISFTDADDNNDGFVDHDELLEFMEKTSDNNQSLGITANSLLATFDTDSDGKLNAKEFNSIYNFWGTQS